MSTSTRTRSVVATPAKLRSGEWGARVTGGRVEKGDEITIRAKSGKSWTATVEQIIWSGDGVTLVATEGSGGKRSGRGGSRPTAHQMDRCGSCGAPNPSQSSYCPHCGGFAD